MERIKMAEMNPPYIIAEIGFNHEGDMDTAKRMIEEAASAGVDAVKFQTYRAGDIALPSAPRYEARLRGQMDFKQHSVLAKVASDNGVDFLSTPYSPWAVDLLEKVGVKAYKIASMDLTNVELLRYIAKTKKPIIVSTGMATLPEIRSTVKMLRSLKSGPITLLHCLSKYPANPADINLAIMDRIRKICRCPVGYSDHTKGTTACLVAAILGAKIIEKHFTLDPSRRGADHYHSADPVQLKQLIEDIRLALSIIGSSNRLIRRRIDRQDAKRLRRGVYACVDIPKGAKILRDYLFCCRPEASFSPRDLDTIVGRIARYNIKRDSPITKDAVKTTSKRNI